jgi:hypothetical protein
MHTTADLRSYAAVYVYVKKSWFLQELGSATKLHVCPRHVCRTASCLSVCVMSVSLYVCTSAFLHVCMHACMYVCMYVGLSLLFTCYRLPTFRQRLFLHRLCSQWQVHLHTQSRLLLNRPGMKDSRADFPFNLAVWEKIYVKTKRR